MLTTIASGRTYNYSHVVGRAAGSGPGFQLPTALAIGQNNVIYVVSRGNESNFGSRVGKVAIGGPGEEEYLCEFAKYGNGPADVLWPSAVASDLDGTVCVAGEWHNRISVFDANGNLVDKWGMGGTGDGELNHPSGMAFDQEGNLCIVDSTNHRIQKFTKNGCFLHKFGEHGSDQGQFNLPWGLAVDNYGHIYVADWGNHRVQKFSSDGSFLMTFGTFGTGVGQLNYPTDVTVDGDGDVYVCDWANHRVQIFGPDGDVITSLIGDAYELSKWAQMSIDANPDMLKARRRVKSLEPEWRFLLPTAVAFDRLKGQLLVADCQRDRVQIYIKDKNYVDPQFNL